MESWRGGQLKSWNLGMEKWEVETEWRVEEARRIEIFEVEK